MSKLIAGVSIVVGGGLLAVVHQDVTGISTDMIPIGVRFFIYPLAVLAYLTGSGICLFSCFSRSRRHLWSFAGITINLISMILLLSTWLLIIRLYVLPLGRGTCDQGEIDGILRRKPWQNVCKPYFRCL